MRILRYSLQMNLNEVSHPACTITSGAWDGGVTGGELGPVDLRLLETLAFLAHSQLLGLEGRGLGPTRV